MVSPSFGGTIIAVFRLVFIERPAMKNLLISTIAPLASLLLILGAGGCYTQLGTVRNEGAYEGDTTSEITGNSAAEDDSDASYGYDDQDQQYGYGEDWGMQSRFGFNYYY